MTMNEKIEEMARAIGNSRNACLFDDCLKCWIYGACMYQEIARDLYDNDYRRQTEGEWVFEHEFYGKMLCSNCKEEALVNECNEYVDSNFCPNCGAKMKKTQN